MRRSSKVGLLTLCAGASLVACTSAFLIIDYPVTPHEKPKRTEAEDCEHDRQAENLAANRYWSAYARLEARDILRLWDDSPEDYLLISAKVRLPTHNGPIERDFPLFTIDDRQVARQDGVDLLQKFPLSGETRDQVSITIEVRFFENHERLKMAQSILNEASKAAQPFLGQFTVATKILGSAIPMIDQALSTKDLTPSSAGFAVIPADLSREEDRLKAFLIFGLDEGEKARRACQRQKPCKGCTRTTPCTEDAYTFDYHSKVYECTNHEGRLCTGWDSDAGLEYEEHRVEDAVYLTIDFVPFDDVLDPAVLLRATSSHCELITQSAVDAARKYLTENQSLFAIEDFDAAQHTYRAAENYLQLRAAMASHDIATVMLALEKERDQLNVIDRLDLSEHELTDCDHSGRLKKIEERKEENAARIAEKRETDAVICNAESNANDCLRRRHAADRYSAILNVYERGLQQCRDNAWEQTPAVEAWQVWSLYRTEQKCDAIAAPAALRLDLLTLGLQKMAVLTGASPDLIVTDKWRGSGNAILRLLQREAADLLAAELTVDYTKVSCKDKDEAAERARSVSVFCEKCWTDLSKACGKAWTPRLQAIRSERRGQLEPMLEYIRKQDDGELHAPLGCNTSFKGCEAAVAP